MDVGSLKLWFRDVGNGKIAPGHAATGGTFTGKIEDTTIAKFFM